ncbi:TPA: transcriptional repressor NrdR, partial [Listeria monocytogenes]|nr:transcriptional repressor NrdR [Listeria monocytogenes]
KVRRGLIRACEKRPVSAEQIEEIVNEVERELRNIGDSEIASDLIGEKVMNKLANLDEVAYVRFASVYRQFKDISVFVEELKDLMEKNKDR